MMTEEEFANLCEKIDAILTLDDVGEMRRIARSLKDTVELIYTKKEE